MTDPQHMESAQWQFKRALEDKYVLELMIIASFRAAPTFPLNTLGHQRLMNYNSNETMNELFYNNGRVWKHLCTLLT